MTDDLKAQLRALNTCGCNDGEGGVADVAEQAAARIEALEAEKALFRQVFEHLDRRKRDAPGHNHEVPGIWDNDSSNGDKAGTPCEWCALWSEVRAALARPRAAEPTVADMAAFGASDAACTLYPGPNQQAERAAFCEGAAHAVSSPPAAVGEEIDLADRIVQAWEVSPRQFPITAQHQSQMALIAARYILALQSSPAKVEG